MKMILGNIESRENKPGSISRNVELRNELDLFAYNMHCKSFPGVRTRHQDVDILIIRQNTEGEYAMLEHEVDRKSQTDLQPHPSPFNSSFAR